MTPHTTRTSKPSPRVTAAILAGGQSSRWRGLPKGLLQLPGGLSIIEHTLAAVAAARVAEVAIFANDPDPYHHLGLPIIPDRRPGLGPLGGIEAALLHYSGRAGGVLILPCDLPNLTARELRALLATFSPPLPPVVVAQTPDCFWHPLCAVVRTDLLPAVTHALDSGNRGVYRLWRALGATPVLFADPGPFFNLNTPDDFARLFLGRRRPLPALKLV